MDNGDDMIAEGGPVYDDNHNVIGRIVSITEDNVGLKIVAVPTILPLGSNARGPRNVPKPDARKKRRQHVREQRRRNR